MSGRKGVQIDLLLQMKMSLCFVEIKRKQVSADETACWRSG